MGRRGRKGETQKERRTRVKNKNKPNVYFGMGIKLPKNWSRAMRRHPPTHCLRCEVKLTWDVARARYVDLENIGDFCGVDDEREHELANGKRAHRYAGYQGTAR